MDLIALRYIFEGEKGRESFGKPKVGITPLRVSEKEHGQFVAEQNGYWEIKTHDRGEDTGKPSFAYFQIAFRLEGTEKEKGEHKVSINSPLGNQSKEDSENNLWYDSENDLWYQRTMFDKKGKPKKDSKYGVDSITTAGVFEVNVIEKSTEKHVITKQIQVMPSSIAKAEYQMMLDQLIEIHERFITESSSVGVGKMAAQGSIFKSNGEWNYALWEEMKPLLLAISIMPSDLLKKEYTRISKEKLRRFDSHVLRSYIQREGAGRLDGVTYAANYDSYENRIIKTFLLKLSQRKYIKTGEIIDIEQQLFKDLSKEYINIDINSMLAEVPTIGNMQDSSSLKSFELPVKHNIKEYGSGSQRAPVIQVNYDWKKGQYIVNTNNTDEKSFLHYPFYHEGVHCGIILETLYADVALRFVEFMSDLFNVLGDGRIPDDGKVIIKGIGEFHPVNVDDYDIKESYLLKLTGFESAETSWQMNSRKGSIQIPESITLDKYFTKIREIKSKNQKDYITINARMDVMDFTASRRTRYEKINMSNSQLIKQHTVRSEMKSMVHNTWFKNIQQLPRIELPIKATPKFSFNKYYRSIYEILQKYIELHPLLTSDFDTNAFGVKETWQIYEYWVFSELLNRFMNLGFKMVSGEKSVRDSLVSFFESSGQPEGFQILLEKRYKIKDEEKSIEILFGYNSFIGDQTDRLKGDRHYTPDYFFRIKAKDSYHWYFMDAKYNVYKKGSTESTSKNLFQEIYDVSVYKYIHRMTEEKFLKTMTEQKAEKDPATWNVKLDNYVAGAYIIVANIIEGKTDDLIADEDRLYGGTVSLASQYSPSTKKITTKERSGDKKLFYPSVDDGERGLPRHRYGAIQFRPGYEDELTALLEMVFEYKETEKEGLLSQFGQTKTRPENLNLCWDSTFDHKNIPMPRIDMRQTKGGKFKFVVTCQCGAQRYENHCLCGHGIIKHNFNNYHYRKLTGKKFGDKWNYVCPVCGEDLSSEEGNTTK